MPLHGALGQPLDHLVDCWPSQLSGWTLCQPGQQMFYYLWTSFCQIIPLVRVCTDIKKPHWLPQLIASLLKFRLTFWTTRKCLWWYPVPITHISCQQLPVTKSQCCPHDCVPDPKAIEYQCLVIWFSSFPRNWVNVEKNFSARTGKTFTDASPNIMTIKAMVGLPRSSKPQ